MLLACGPAMSTSFVVFLVAMLVVFLGVPLVNLGALTAVLFRPGPGLRSIRNVGRMAVAVGVVVTAAGIGTPVLLPFGLAQIGLGLWTIRRNRPRPSVMDAPVER